ncbi:hypothetical protein S83_012256, partial [Arachis hypogaea]
DDLRSWILDLGSSFLTSAVNAACKAGNVVFATPRLSEDKVKQCVDPKLGAEYPPKAIAKILAVARKNGQIKILSPVSGDLHATISSSSDLDLQSDVVSLHLFAKANLKLST